MNTKALAVNGASSFPTPPSFITTTKSRLVSTRINPAATVMRKKPEAFLDILKSACSSFNMPVSGMANTDRKAYGRNGKLKSSLTKKR